MEDIEKNCKLINDIIKASVYYGGDAGGPYLSDNKDLLIALNNYINDNNLSGKVIINNFIGYEIPYLSIKLDK